MKGAISKPSMGTVPSTEERARSAGEETRRAWTVRQEGRTRLVVGQSWVELGEVGKKCLQRVSSKNVRV